MASELNDVDLPVITKLVGEVTALRLALQAVTFSLAHAAGLDNDAIAKMHSISQQTLSTFTFLLKGFDEAHIRSYAEAMIDDIFVHINLPGD